MMWTVLDSWIVVTAVLCAVACALLGNFLVLRRLSMMGDAISHAVLPGLALAFLWTGSRGHWSMFVGAVIMGLLTAWFTQSLSRFGRVDEGASMGTVFTLLFAIGLVIMVRGADAVDLDPNCVLFGAIELTPLDEVTWLDVTAPRAVWMLAGVTGLNALFVVLFYKELKVTSFDESFAGSIGLRPSVMHYGLMTLVAVTAVASFESVGSILVIAMLIVPAATAFLCTYSLGHMIIWSVGFAALSAVVGHGLAITVPRLWGYADTSTAGMMAVMSGLLFSGAYARWRWLARRPVRDKPDTVHTS